MSDFLKINGHGHLLPYPEEIPPFMKREKFFWVDDERKYMYQDDWQRPITDPSFFLNEKLEWMDKHDIQHEVILNLSQLYANGRSQAAARDITRFQNEYNAFVEYNNPQKFTCGFVVQAAYLDDALHEIDRCVRDLKMSLLCLPTHFIDQVGQWKSIAHEDTKPIWELANEYGLAIEIHPYDAPKMIALQNQFWRFHLVWMCAQTADTFHCYTLLDFPDLYPNTRVCFAHGNQFGQVNLGRRVQGFEGRPDLFENTRHPKSNFINDNVFFDSLVHDVYAFRLLKDRQGTSQIIAGLDDPYPLGEMETVPNCYPGKVIDEAVEMDLITTDERASIWKDNVARWLYGKDVAHFYERIGLDC